MRKPATPKTARAGSTVEIDIPNGRRRDGSQEWKTVRARVHMVCSTHLVCQLLSDKRGAHPRVAEAYRLIIW